MGDEQHGAPGEQGGREFLKPHPRDHVEGRERLVHQDDGAVFHQRAGQGDPLSHTAGEGARQGAGFRAQADPFEQRPGARLVRPRTAQAGAECHIVQRTEPGEKQVLLRHVGNAPVAGDAQRAGLQAFEARDDAQKARLADAARPQEAGPAVALQRHVQAVEEERVGEAQAGTLDADGRVLRR